LANFSIQELDDIKEGLNKEPKEKQDMIYSLEDIFNLDNDQIENKVFTLLVNSENDEK
jgi:hypothetical protein